MQLKRRGEFVTWKGRRRRRRHANETHFVNLPQKKRGKKGSITTTKKPPTYTTSKPSNVCNPHSNHICQSLRSLPLICRTRLEHIPKRRSNVQPHHHSKCPKLKDLWQAGRRGRRRQKFDTFARPPLNFPSSSLPLFRETGGGGWESRSGLANCPSFRFQGRRIRREQSH